MSLECSIPQPSLWVYKLAQYIGQSLRLSTFVTSSLASPLHRKVHVRRAKVVPSQLVPVPRSEFSTTPGFRIPCRASLSSDMSDYDYDFSQFGQWDGDSASYYEEDDQYRGTSRTSHLRASLSSPRVPTPPLRLPSPLTPLASPSTFVQEEFVQGSSGTQYEYTLTDIHGEPLSGLPSPITRPSSARVDTPRPVTPLEYEEEFDIRTQVAVRSAPRPASPELVYPDPPSEPAPPSRPVSAPPRVPSRASPTSPLLPPAEQENLPPAVPLFRPPSCLNSPEDHPHLYTALYTPEGESWRPASESIRGYFHHIPLAPDLVRRPVVFPSVTPFRIPPPHVYTIRPRLIDPSVHSDFPALYVCSKAILDLPSPDLPLGSVRDRQVRRYYPSTSYYDLSESSRIDCWTDPPLVLKNLVNLFEFGELISQDSYNDFVDDLSAVVDACNDQLLFWHLSDIIADQLLLWTKSDYLWFNYIPPRRDYLIRQLQVGHPHRYIDRFRLSYEEIQLSFCEVRLVDREGPPRLVITEGTELTYSWSSATWETTLTNPDQSLVNPRVFHDPPTDPNDPELVELLVGRTETNPLSLLARLSLPASSPETEETSNHSIRRVPPGNSTPIVTPYPSTGYYLKPVELPELLVENKDRINPIERSSAPRIKSSTRGGKKAGTSPCYTETPNRIPIYFTDPFFSLVDDLIYATFNKQPVTSPDGHFPWVHVVTQKRLTAQDFEEAFPNIRKVRKLDWAILLGSFKKKRVSWSYTQECWVYGNNRAVRFSDSEEQSESEQSLTPLSPTNAPGF
ncbi:hypothetical protein EDB84DRAFT_1568627 [Lactarius hengduanensis]|nr:hypothetical protein EDB84DRAFT_1568627 [Lactarius hengduanensis]